MYLIGYSTHSAIMYAKAQDNWERNGHMSWVVKDCGTEVRVLSSTELLMGTRGKSVYILEGFEQRYDVAQWEEMFHWAGCELLKE